MSQTDTIAYTSYERLLLIYLHDSGNFPPRAAERNIGGDTDDYSP